MSFTKEQRVELEREFANVPDDVRALMFMVMNGYCPFCFLAPAASRGDVLGLIRRGMTGSDLRNAIAEMQAGKDGIDRESGHAIDCRAMATLKGEA